MSHLCCVLLVLGFQGGRGEARSPWASKARHPEKSCLPIFIEPPHDRNPAACKKLACPHLENAENNNKTYLKGREPMRSHQHPFPVPVTILQLLVTVMDVRSKPGSPACVTGRFHSDQDQ